VTVTALGSTVRVMVEQFTRHGASWRWYVPLGLALAIAAEVAYVSLFSPFYTTDATLQLSTSAALGDSIGGFDLGTAFLEWNPWPAPNVLSTLLLSGLIALFGAEWGERLVALGYVVALPWAALYAIRSSCAANDWFAFFALPLTFSLTFMYGFFNFSYSVLGFLVLAGFVLRSDVSMPGRRGAALAALLVLAFFTHFVGFLASCLLILVVFAVRAALHAEDRRRILFQGGLVLLPGALLTILFVASSDSASVVLWTAPTLSTLSSMATLVWGLASWDALERHVCRLLAATLWALVLVAAVRRRPWREREPDIVALCVFALAAALVAVIAPSEVASGGSLLSERLVLFPVLGAVLWLSRQRLPNALVVGAAVVAVVAAGALAGLRYDELREGERIIDDLHALAPCVEGGTTIVQANASPLIVGSAGRIDAFADEAGRLSVRRDGLDLSNVAWAVPFSLQQFRADVDPTDRLFLADRHWAVPPPLDLETYERRAGVTVDYVLLRGRRGLTEETRRSGTWRRFEGSLRREHRLLMTSPRGLWELWATGRRACEGTAS